MNGGLDRGSYDEDDLAKRLSALSSRARASFACACAERLMPSFRWSCLTTGSGNYEVVRQALDMAWAVGAPRQSAELDAMRNRVMEAAPNAGDPELFPGAAVAQNAVAAVCYALEACLTDEVQPAVWAARQLYEAADAVVQQGAAVQ